MCWKGCLKPVKKFFNTVYNFKLLYFCVNPFQNKFMMSSTESLRLCLFPQQTRNWVSSIQIALGASYSERAMFYLFNPVSKWFLLKSTLRMNSKVVQKPITVQSVSYPLLLTQNQIGTSSISYIVDFVVPFVLKQTTHVNMSFEKQKPKQFNLN